MALEPRRRAARRRSARWPAPTWRDWVGQAVESIGTSLDEQTTCAELALFLCRRLCEAAAVDLLPEPVTTSRTGPGTRSATGLDRVAAAGRTELLQEGVPQDAHGLSVRACCWAATGSRRSGCTTGAPCW
ncbi:hypothetical protein ACSHWO_36725 (plasmid) [Streptomyces sp. HUAS TT3]|uniref:hypothetical protein n=1 Tax=Streptomyces sp. HUAS TT3 TaxID=3447510 RepID=UPI003F65C027